MDWIQATVLALIQAITEFLPISSSGHLILAPHVFGWQDQGLLFDIAANTGTLLAVLVYFREDVGRLTQGFVRTLANRSPTSDPDGYLAWAVGFATIPAGLAGLAFKNLIEDYARSPALVATTLILFGLLLGVADLWGKREKILASMTWSHALLIGVGQALALIPGTSRSGITLTVGLLLGYNREGAARFAFYLAIPIGVLAGILDIRDLMRAQLSAQDWLAMAIGVGVSALAGYLVIHLLLGWVRKHSLMPFVVYRLLLGAAIFAFLV
ncbi:MAG: undecaprenyl-diphosphate phosphatase [Magnetococcales bacterium]|nr:undecaprenyl-diphosphate phosphatase [Magnetococcales bacterium]NGZ29064.1 undecaprenyl-diphosphate phosphatase [Magnetococcales bacterium]